MFAFVVFALASGIQPQAAEGKDVNAATQLRRAIAANPSNLDPYFALAHLQEEQGLQDEAEATLLSARAARPDDRRAYLQLAWHYNRRGDFDRTIGALRDYADRDPQNPEGYYTIGTYYWDKVFRDFRLVTAQKWLYVEEGLAALERALMLKPDYMEALTYKNILLRMKANMEPDPGVQKQLIAEADALRNRAIELQKRRIADPIPHGARVPPPSHMPPGAVRVGGNIKPPQKVYHADPVYPADARAARVQGVVIVEATIGIDGAVDEARVLRSIPLLDQAAIDAVKQWRFMPTVLGGQAVPVMMTVTVNFTLD